MTQFELAQLAKKISNLYIFPWHKREKEKFNALRKSRHPGAFDDFYSYVINEWILEQPDKDSLMKLFILVGFDMPAFFRLIVSPDPGKKRTTEAA